MFLKKYIGKVYFLFLNYLFFLFIGLAFKAFFWIHNTQDLQAGGLTDFFQILRHGAVLDSSMASYLSLIPLLLALLSLLFRRGLKSLLLFYYVAILFVYVSLHVINVYTYPYWHVPVDASLLFYIKTPKAALASAPGSEALLGFFFFFILFFLFVFLAWRYLLPLFLRSQNLKSRLIQFPLILVMAGLFVIGIRGGVGVSIASTGNAYFSDNNHFNNAAINPVFSIIESTYRQNHLHRQFNFMSEDEMKRSLSDLKPAPNANDSVVPLRNHRPTVVLVMMESFSANAVASLGGYRGATPHIDSLSQEGLLYTHCYATQFRTDHGLVCMLNGVPGIPSSSLMRFQAKTQHVPSLAKSLASAGYESTVVYGGDINFTNMRGYFYNTGYNRLIWNKDYPKDLYRSKWGVRDHHLFQKAYDTILADHQAGKTKQFYTVITLSSHEPFDVPEQKFEHPYLNSVAYTDQELGSFIRRLQGTPLWKDLLIVCLGDHGFSFPNDLVDYEPSRFRILQLWLGGVLENKGVTIDHVTSQVDFPATLLSSMQISTEPYVFSRNVLSKAYRPFAYYTIGSYIGSVSEQTHVAYDFNSQQNLIPLKTAADSLQMKQTKAYIQNLTETFDAY